MAGICCGVVGEGDTTAPIEPSSRPSRRRSLDLLPLKYIADMAVQPPEGSRKRPNLDLSPRDCQNAVENCEKSKVENCKKSKVNDRKSVMELEECPKFGVTSVCGRRRDMEDSFSVRPSFSREGIHYFGVFDGHGCSHVRILLSSNGSGCSSSACDSSCW